MKKEITRKQWNEIDNEQKQKFLGRIPLVEYEKLLNEGFLQVLIPKIGGMIEFLGDSFDIEIVDGNIMTQQMLTTEDLCDHLWETVKSKLMK